MSARGVNSFQAIYNRLIADGQCSRQQAENHRKQNEWIWEYILKNCEGFHIPTLLIDTIPIPDTPMIKRLALLKLLSLDSAAGLIREQDLSALQGLMDLGRTEDGKIDENLYKVEVLYKCELVLQHLRDTEDWESFNTFLDKYWGEVVHDTEEITRMSNSEVEKLRTELRVDLHRLKKNPKLKNYILDVYSSENLENALKGYLERALRELGPVFLEKAEEDILEGRYVPGAVNGGNGSVNVGNGGEVKGNGAVNGSANDGRTKNVRKILLPSLDEGREALADDSGSPRIVQPPWTGENEKQARRKLRRACEDDERGGKKQRPVHSPDVKRALNEFKKSQAHLKEQVSDPLPEAIEVAKGLKNNPDNNAKLMERNDAAKTHEGNEPLPETIEVEKGSKDNPDNKVKLMERNHTAKTYEWEEDDIEMSPSDSKRVNLPSTSTKKVSPLHKADTHKSVLHRRKFKRWTTAEEDALRKGVEQFGKGRWKAILQSNLDVFENRTEVDLKDKWRNIERAEGIKRES